MSTLKQWAYGLALLAALAMWGYSNHQQHQAALAGKALAEDRLQNTQDRLARQVAINTTIGAAFLRERAAQVALQTTQTKLRQSLVSSLNRIKELTRENAELRDWAAQPLPAAARRLRERPAITGAAGYRDWLSRRSALLATPGQPEQ